MNNRYFLFFVIALFIVITQFSCEGDKPTIVVNSLEFTYDGLTDSTDAAPTNIFRQVDELCAPRFAATVADAAASPRFRMDGPDDPNLYDDYVCAGGICPCGSGDPGDADLYLLAPAVEEATTDFYFVTRSANSDDVLFTSLAVIRQDNTINSLTPEVIEMNKKDYDCYLFDVDDYNPANEFLRMRFYFKLNETTPADSLDFVMGYDPKDPELHNGLFLVRTDLF